MSTIAVLESLKQPTAEPSEHGGVMDDGLYEIVYGQRVEKQMSAFATSIASRLGFRLQSHNEVYKLGRVEVEMLFILNRAAKLHRRPDVSFVSAKTWPLDRPLPETGDWEIVPDLAVEVASPHDSMEKLIQKVREYIDVGVQLVWLVLPQSRQIQIHPATGTGNILNVGATLEAPDLLPGFRLPLAELFPHPAPATNGEQLTDAKP